MPQAPEEVIDQFRGDYRFLSNFSPYPAAYRDVWFLTSEHAFAAAKTTDQKWIQRILDVDVKAPFEAKQLGRTAPLRENWDQIKPGIMHEILRSKFIHNDTLSEKLRATGDRLLIEGNTWGDDFWGRVQRRGSRALVGRNMLGRTLMRVRSELQGQPVTRWSRVALTGHRELALDPDTRVWVRDELHRLAVKLRDQHGTTTAITGIATGSDTWWAQAAQEAGLTVWAYQPFPEQPARWPREQQQEHARILEHAQRTVLVGERFSRSHYDLRNGLMIDDADAVIAVRDPRIQTGGTVSALNRYCAGRPVIKVNVETREVTFAASYVDRPWTLGDQTVRNARESAPATKVTVRPLDGTTRDSAGSDAREPSLAEAPAAAGPELIAVTFPPGAEASNDDGVRVETNTGPGLPVDLEPGP